MKPELIDIPVITDTRGDLAVIEAIRNTGFVFKRVYYFGGTNAKRGAHAHKHLRQLIVCVTGSVVITLEGAYGKQSFTLNTRHKGLLVPPGSWRNLESFSENALVMVFASEVYDEGDYIRDYDIFKNWLTQPVSSVPYIPMDRMILDMEGDLQSAFFEVMRKGQFIGGDIVSGFESLFARYCGAAHAIGCGNGLDALALILEGYGIGKGDEVIIPANSFIATGLAVSRLGATPVFADCLPCSYGIDASDAARRITPRTRAIIPVHLYGICADMDALMKLAAQHDLKIIEDAAQAHGATYKGRRAGTLGHAAAFSFYPTKNLGAFGDGGAVVTNDGRLAAQIRLLGNYGSVKKYHHDIKGWNTRLDTLQAALLARKLPRLDGWNARRRLLADIYRTNLSGLPGVTLPTVPEGCEAIWHVYPILVHGGRRDALQARLKSQGVDTLIHYPVPIHKQAAYADISSGLTYTVAEDASAGLLSLPLDPYHTEAEISYTASCVKGFF